MLKSCCKGNVLWPGLWSLHTERHFRLSFAEARVRDHAEGTAEGKPYPWSANPRKQCAERQRWCLFRGGISAQGTSPLLCQRGNLCSTTEKKKRRSRELEHTSSFTDPRMFQANSSSGKETEEAESWGFRSSNLLGVP